MAYPLLVMFLCAGCRMSEVLGMELEDVSFDRRTVTVRENGWRWLKTAGSFRVIPMFRRLRKP